MLLICCYCSFAFLNMRIAKNVTIAPTTKDHVVLKCDSAAQYRQSKPMISMKIELTRYFGSRL